MTIHPLVQPRQWNLFCNLVILAGGNVWEFCAHTRRPEMVHIRRQVWIAMRTSSTGGLRMSWPEIARASGHHNHSTVITATRRASADDRKIAVRLLANLTGKSRRRAA
jgi:chromosomal replication initiation ATPase DnaA